MITSPSISFSFLAKLLITNSLYAAAYLKYSLSLSESLYNSISLCGVKIFLNSLLSSSPIFSKNESSILPSK